MDASLVTSIASLVAVVAAAIGLAVRIEQRFNRLDRRIDGLSHEQEQLERRVDRLAAGLRSLNQQLSSLFTLLSSVLSGLHRAKSLPDDEYRAAMGTFAELVSQGTAPLMESIIASQNPLTHEEVSRFRQLVDKAQHGGIFNRSEAEEYNRLLRKVREDKGDDPSIWPLVALGAFLAGLYLGSRQDDET